MKKLFTTAAVIAATLTAPADACGWMSACRAPGVHAYFGPQLRLYSRSYYGPERIGPIGGGAVVLPPAYAAAPPPGPYYAPPVAYGPPAYGPPPAAAVILGTIMSLMGR